MMSNCWQVQAAVKASGGGESGLWLKEALAGVWVRAKRAAKVQESPGSWEPQHAVQTASDSSQEEKGQVKVLWKSDCPFIPPSSF